MKKITNFLTLFFLSAFCFLLFPLRAQQKGTAAPIIIEQNSEMYKMSVQVQGKTTGGMAGTQNFNYVYSSSILFSQDFLDYLNANYPGMQNLIPPTASELAVPYFKGNVSGDAIQVSSTGAFEFFGWFYGGVNSLNVFTLEYWDDMVNVLVNEEIVPGKVFEIRTSYDVLLAYYNGETFVRNEAAIDNFYAENKLTYVNESITVTETYGYVDGELQKIMQEIINRENVDVYDLSGIKICAADFVPVTNISGILPFAKVGESHFLNGVVEPENATNQNIVWSIKDAGTTGATITDNIFNTTNAGIATVTATITDGTALGTPYTQDFTITVNSGSGIVGAYRIDPIQIYPNPTTGVLNLIQEQIKNYELKIENVEIYDIYGRNVHSFTRLLVHSINISHLPNGIYFVKIQTELGEIVKKVVKE